MVSMKRTKFNLSLLAAVVAVPAELGAVVTRFFVRTSPMLVAMLVAALACACQALVQQLRRPPQRLRPWWCIV